MHHLIFMFHVKYVYSTTSLEFEWACCNCFEQISNKIDINRFCKQKFIMFDVEGLNLINIGCKRIVNIRWH